MNLTQIIHECAPEVAPSTLEAIIKVESGGTPLVIHDNTTGLNYYPETVSQGAAIVRTLTAQGHLLDVGLCQVDTENFQSYSLTPSTAFNVCANVKAAGQILTKAYQLSEQEYGPGQLALLHAFEAYNSGQLRGDPSYASRVLAAAGQPLPTVGPLPISTGSSSAYQPIYWTKTYQPNW